MKFSRNSGLFVAALLALVGSSSADVVGLKNGDRTTGKVITKQNDKLSFETSYAGKIEITWAEVAELRTDTPVEVMLAEETDTTFRFKLGYEW